MKTLHPKSPLELAQKAALDRKDEEIAELVLCLMRVLSTQWAKTVMQIKLGGPTELTLIKAQQLIAKHK